MQGTKAILRKLASSGNDTISHRMTQNQASLRLARALSVHNFIDGRSLYNFNIFLKNLLCHKIFVNLSTVGDPLH